jgi:hypothetical protein
VAVGAALTTNFLEPMVFPDAKKPLHSDLSSPPGQPSPRHRQHSQSP